MVDRSGKMSLEEEILIQDYKEERRQIGIKYLTSKISYFEYMDEIKLLIEKYSEKAKSFSKVKN